MKACTFFGHRECDGNIGDVLYDTLTALIEKKGVDTFYVGNQGLFDMHVRTVLKELKNKYPEIMYYVVLAYVPRTKIRFDVDYENHTLVPDGIEEVPKRFAIIRRNQWMLQKSEYVVAYVRHDWGGAAKFVAQARKMGKWIINV